VDGGTMNWGRWSGGQVIDLLVGGGTLAYSPGTGVPFVVGNANTTVPASGSFTYSFAGAPSPVNTAGAVGTFTGGAFNVSFGTTNTVSVASPLTMSVGGVSYTLSSGGGSGPGGQAVFGNISLSGTCNGGACATSGVANASAAGMLVGPQAAGLAVAGVVTSPAPMVSFAAGFKR
jgi:hypothetical protein